MKRSTKPLTRLRNSLVPPRLFLVPSGPVVLFLSLYLLPDVAVEVLRLVFDVPRTNPDPKVFAEFQHNVVLVAGAFYGLVRAMPFHPFTRPGYAAWLEQTPWTVRQPLPLGPVHLVLRDVLAIAGLSACGVRVGTHWALPAAVVAIGYLAVLNFLLLVRVRALREATVLAFGLPVFVLLRDRPEWMLAVAAVLYGVGYAGLRRSLAAFPWRDRDDPHPSLKPPKLDSLGWPLKQLSPLSPARPPLSQWNGWLIATLVGWWLFGALALFGQSITREPEPHPMQVEALMLIGLAGGALVAIYRLGIYVGGMASPMSTFARIVTGRLILPRYDHVLVAPAIAWLLAILAPAALYHFLPIGPATALAGGTVFVLAAAINIGPTLRSWRLTGAGSYLAPANRPNKPDADELTDPV